MGGGILATLWSPAILRAAPLELVKMRGTAHGERVCFMPHGLAVSPGTTIRFVNRDPGKRKSLSQGAAACRIRRVRS